MTTAQKQPVLVVLQLNGGNDYLNTVVPRDDPAYFDNRRTLGVPEDNVLGIDDEMLRDCMGKTHLLRAYNDFCSVAP